MNVRIEHVGVWVADIDRVAAFYARYFGAQVGDLYRNAAKGFESRFLTFAGGARLEVMTRQDVTGRAANEQLGLAHVALSVGDEATVDALAARLRADGMTPDSGPRRTGDGYYECVVRDPGRQSCRDRGWLKRSMKITVRSVLLCCVRVLPPRRRNRLRPGPEVTGSREAVDALVVAGQRGRRRRTSRHSSKRSPPRASAASRSRRSTARAAARRATCDFLSPQWMEMLEHTAREAARLGLGVDMATGTGWPFGGPTVSAADGSSSLALRRRKARRQADGDEGEARGAGRRGPGARSLFDRRARSLPAPVLQGVRRRAPARIARASSTTPSSTTTRAGRRRCPTCSGRCTATTSSRTQRAFGGEQSLDDDTLSRIKGDYRRTLAKLHLDYVNAWVTWSHEEGFQARNQAHGAPGNLLDSVRRRGYSRDRILRPDGAADRRACAAMRSA